MSDLLAGLTSADLNSLGNDELWDKFYGDLSQDELAKLQEELSRVPYFAPNPGPQTSALNNKADILGYGGAAGGGKTSLAVMLSIQYHHNIVFYRNDIKQCNGLITEMLTQLGDNDKGLHRGNYIWALPDHPGHLVQMGGLGMPGSETKFQGQSFDLIVYDEVTEIPFNRIGFTMGWNRTAREGQRCRVLMTFNPPTSQDSFGSGSVDGSWVRDYFAPWINERHLNPALSGEIRYFYTDERGKEVECLDNAPRELKMHGENHIAIPKSRSFIRARIQDNPSLMETGYYQHLLSLKGDLRERLLFGNFGASAFDSINQVLPTEWVDDAMDRWTEDGRNKRMDSIGVDVARGGKCNTVMSKRHGVWFDNLVVKEGTSTPDGPSVMSMVSREVRDNARINIDSNVVGASPYDFMRQSGMNVYGVMGQIRVLDKFAKLEDRLELYNLRTWMWWLMRKMLDPANELRVSLPKDNALRAELISVHHSDRSGILQVETKLEVIKRLSYSPDRADAVLYSLVNLFESGGGDAYIERLRFTRAVPKLEHVIDHRMAGGGGWMSQ